MAVRPDAVDELVGAAVAAVVGAVAVAAVVGAVAVVVVRKVRVVVVAVG